MRWPRRFAGRFEDPDLARRHADARLKEEKEVQPEARSRGPTEDGKDGQGERLMETISCRNSAVIKRAQENLALARSRLTTELLRLIEGLQTTKNVAANRWSRPCQSIAGLFRVGQSRRRACE
jgi:hypothetical protein